MRIKFEHHNLAQKRNIFALDFLSFLFILAAPYLNFVESNGILFDYVNIGVIAVFMIVSVVFSIIMLRFPSPTLRLCILTLLFIYFLDLQFGSALSRGYFVAACLVATFVIWLLRSHLSLILVVAFGVMNVSTLGINASTAGIAYISSSTQKIAKKQSVSPTRKFDLPVYVHVILDEQMGIEGFQNDVPSHRSIKIDMNSFFLENKFRVFGRAYSPYYNTSNSVAAILNLKTTNKLDNIFSRTNNIKHIFSPFRYTMLKNKYFEEIIKKGYNINVYQSAYMNYCQSIHSNIKKCLTYNYYGITSQLLAGLTGIEKTSIVLSTYMELSRSGRKFKIFYNLLRGYVAAFGVELPQAATGAKRVGPIPVLPIFDTLIRDVSSSPGGTMFFAHLLIPHYPYSVNSSCEIRRPAYSWRNRHYGESNSQVANSKHTRLTRYEEYIPQVRCALSKIRKLLDALRANGTFEDATIIIHGDHGSRIVLTEPLNQHKDRMSRQDYYDAFSTLYVAKSPSVRPVYSARMVAVPELLRETVSGNLNALDGSGTDESPLVFLRDIKKDENIPVPMPKLPITINHVTFSAERR